MNNKKGNILKVDDSNNESFQHAKNVKYNRTKQFTRKICRDLTIDSLDFKSDKFVETIQNYLDSTNRMDRMMYSEISSYIFGMEEWERDTLISNIDAVLRYSLNEKNKIKKDCCDIIIKIYDHAQLAYQQTNTAERFFAESVENAKESIKDETKGVEKEYIAILGIFAAIVLAFVGGITFSTSVLQNIDAVSPYRLLLVVIILGAVLINVIYMLIGLIFKINENYEEVINIRIVNIVIAIVIGVIILAWVFNIDVLPHYIAKSLPWTKP